MSPPRFKAGEGGGGPAPLLSLPLPGVSHPPPPKKKGGVGVSLRWWGPSRVTFGGEGAPPEHVGCPPTPWHQGVPCPQVVTAMGPVSVPVGSPWPHPLVPKGPLSPSPRVLVPVPCPQGSWSLSPRVPIPEGPCFVIPCPQGSPAFVPILEPSLSLNVPILEGPQGSLVPLHKSPGPCPLSPRVHVPLSLLSLSLGVPVPKGPDPCPQRSPGCIPCPQGSLVPIREGPCPQGSLSLRAPVTWSPVLRGCLLYTSDAADE